MTRPRLSIVTPTRGAPSEVWLDHLRAISGDVERILVYPCAATEIPRDDRIRALVSPFRGELMQRLFGLLNARGDYVLALDDDDFVHPRVDELVAAYFARFPQSWVLRLASRRCADRDERRMAEEWAPLPAVADAPVVAADVASPAAAPPSLVAAPIAPLRNRFDPKLVFTPLFGIERADMHGRHMENFNNRVWRNDLVRQTLPDVIAAMRLGGALYWLPATGFDRVLGLFVQAKFFQPDAVIGHWMPKPEQLRVALKPRSQRYVRFHAASHWLLVRAFPRYPYLWNLFLSTWHGIPSAAAESVRRRWRHGRGRGDGVDRQA